MDSMMNAMGFRRVVDYGRPIGFWCPECGSEGAYLGALKVVCVCLYVRMIPVFAVIPEGERPQTTWGETGGDDAVCCEDREGQITYVMGFECGEERYVCSGPRHGLLSDGDPDEWFHWGPYSTVDEIEGADTLENAIRHVAEE